jgi:formylglycine-generating enzyme required for sulfatase activity
MNSNRFIVIGVTTFLCLASVAMADDFGTGVNQFTIDFVTISGDTNPTSGYGIVNGNYRIGVYEVTNDQWNKFQAELGLAVTGADGTQPGWAYTQTPTYIGLDVPTNESSWYEAAQFVNWLNTSTGHHAAYNFTGVQGTGDYTFATWGLAEADGGTNLYRHKDAFYFLPTEDEWVKAAYWNGAFLQAYATTDNSMPVEGIAANYDSIVGDGIEGQPWAAGSGSEELNGTYDMMGNVWEWMESPFSHGEYGVGSNSWRAYRGGSFTVDFGLTSMTRGDYPPHVEISDFGFRVASKVPEPATMGLLVMGCVALLRRRRG